MSVSRNSPSTSSATLKVPELVGTVDINSGGEAPELTDAYRVECDGEVFAVGAFSDVFKGRIIPKTQDVGPPYQEVAIKVYRLAGARLSPEHQKAIGRMTKYLSREVYIWQKLQHKCITPLLGFMRTTPFVEETARSSVISPFYKNGNLMRWLKEHPETDRMALLIQAGEGVAYLHSRSSPIAHLDIKPDNILINDAEEAELCDFGISKVVDEIAPTHTSTSDHATLRYQSPEFLSDTVRTTKADVWAFGGLIIYTLCEKEPYCNINRHPKLLLAIMKGNKPNREHHPIPGSKQFVEEIWNLIDRCYASDHEKERPTIDEVVDELRRIRDNECKRFTTDPPSTLPSTNDERMQSISVVPETIW